MFERHTAFFCCTLCCVSCMLISASLCALSASLSLFVHLSDCLVCPPLSLDSAQISDGQFLSAVCGQPTVHEGEFGRAINSPLHSAEGRVMSRRGFVTRSKQCNGHFKDNTQIILHACLN